MQPFHLLCTNRGMPSLKLFCVRWLRNTVCQEYSAESYDLLRKNCCHFADDLCRRLGEATEHPETHQESPDRSFNNPKTRPGSERPQVQR